MIPKPQPIDGRASNPTTKTSVPSADQERELDTRSPRPPRMSDTRISIQQRGGRLLKGGSIMANTPANSGKEWTPREVAQLRKEAGGNTPTRVIGVHLDRSENSVRNKASEENISLKPTNQSPYGTGGKRKK